MTDTPPPAGAPPARADPETLVLRAQPCPCGAVPPRRDHRHRRARLDRDRRGGLAGAEARVSEPRRVGRGPAAVRRESARRRSIRIDNVPATDTAGYAGLADKVDLHTWQLLKGVALSTLLGVGTELSFGDGESDLVRAIRESAQQSGARAGDQIVMKNLNVQPTLRVRPGWPLRVIVHKDLVFAAPRVSGE